MSLYLGLDCSTQSLSAVAVEAVGSRRTVAWSKTFGFDGLCPAYGTRHGVLPSTGPGEATAPPLMWAEALDCMLAAVAASGLPLHRLAAISGSAQQHGSVYLNGAAAIRLAAMDPGRGPSAQIADAFARAVAPIWMDTSTSMECAEIAAAVGGDARLAEETGSRAVERFTAPQIRRFFKTDPDGYRRTARVHLVSSFLATLLLGDHAPLDPGDASGMNLMSLVDLAWWPPALEATAPDLARRLPSIVPASTVIGRLSTYWQRRHGLPPARLITWTGDNPSTLIGAGLVREGRLGVSLGTSDTIFGPMRTPRVDREGSGNVFGSPTGEFMGLTCCLNGSLARERVRDAYGLDWRAFSQALDRTSPGNDGALMLPWFDHEITPRVEQAGVHRRSLDPNDVARNVRAVVEGQMMALANHSEWMGVEVRTIHAAGGAAVNDQILQVMADVFDADVYRSAVETAACLGAALRAVHADAAADGRPPSWDDIVTGLAEPAASSRIEPRPACRDTCAAARARYAAFEQETLARLGGRS